MQIELDTGQIRDSVNKLKARQQEIDAAIKGADSAIAPLRAMRSPALQGQVQDWDAVKTNFSKSLENLLQAAQALLGTAERNEEANKPGR